MAVPSNNVQQQGQGVASADQFNTYVQTVLNVAVARNFPAQSNMQMSLQGFTTPGDGGQGLFVWSSTSTASDDGGITAIVPNGATQGAWLRLAGVSGVLVVLDFVYEGQSSPPANAFLDGFILPVACVFPPNFGLVGTPTASTLHVQAGFLPGSTYVITINKNDVAIGSLTINTDGTYAYVTVNSQAVPANLGDRITLIGQASPDLSLNQFFGSLIATQGST